MHDWQPAIGDKMVIDTKENRGYLIHTDGRSIDFPVVTGQHRNVCYIGRCYNAATPSRDWIAKSKHIKGDRLTYGKTGRFIRLYDSDGRTHYGIHGYGKEEEMFAQKSLFQSMGCVIVRESILNIIDATFALNKKSLSVITKKGVEDPMHVAFGRDLLVARN